MTENMKTTKVFLTCRKEVALSWRNYHQGLCQNPVPCIMKGGLYPDSERMLMRIFLCRGQQGRTKCHEWILNFSHISCLYSPFDNLKNFSLSLFFFFGAKIKNSYHSKNLNSELFLLSFAASYRVPTSHEKNSAFLRTKIYFILRVSNCSSVVYSNLKSEIKNFYVHNLKSKSMGI